MPAKAGIQFFRALLDSRFRGNDVAAFALPLLLFSAVALADADQDARYHALIQELRCLVCQNQSIADSNAPLADDLRRQVRAQIEAGRSDREIVEYLTARYGDFVLYRPPFRSRTLLLWLGPFVVLLAAGALATFFIRRSRAELAAPDPERLKRVLNKETR